MRCQGGCYILHSCLTAPDGDVMSLCMPNSGNWDCREAAEPAQFGGERRMSSDRFSDRRPQADRFPQTDGFGAAEAMPEGQLSDSVFVRHMIFLSLDVASVTGICSLNNGPQGTPAMCASTAGKSLVYCSAAAT